MVNSRLLKAIELIEKESDYKSLTLGELVNLLGEMGHGIIILLLCLFFLQPIPLPGISTPIGMIIILLSTLQFLNQKPWVPRRFRNREIPQKALHKMAVIARKIWSSIEKFLHPRLLFLTRSHVFRFINLLLLILSGFLLGLPLPIPFSNTIPALVILSIVFAQLEDDGFLIIGGYVLSLGMFFFFYSLGAGVWNFAQRPWASPF
ncbi:exopolysaccharide biosynthesis protein [Bdellovibrio sp. HCB337]|uniref:exopolysaccharide biosynthesis protein n=1 Tax=Bdellovibrio sp. HCB337 TaxID=3394358 RepID=UPI0039A6D3BA